MLNDSDVLQDTPINTTHDFPTNVNQTIKADINGGTAPSFDTAGKTPGEYYIKLTIIKVNVETTYAYEGFTILAASASVTSINDYSSDGAVKKVDFSEDDIICFGTTSDGGVTLDHAVKSNTKCEVFTVLGVSKGVILNVVDVDFVKDVEKTFYSMNGDVLICISGLPLGDYIMKTTVTGVAVSESLTGFTVTVRGEIPIVYPVKVHVGKDPFNVIVR